MPAEAKGTSEQSAKAFVRYYIDVLNFATATGDTDQGRNLSAEGCDSCDAMLSKVEMVHADGGYFRGEGWTVKKVKYQPFQPKGRPVLSVGIQLAPQEMLERPGGKVQHFKGGPNQVTLHLVADDTGWRVEQLDRLS